MRHLPLVLLLVACGGAPDDAASVDSGDTDSVDTDDTSPPGTPSTPTDTWDSFALGFMETYCVSCHDTSPKDFTVHADVAAYADPIRCGVAPTELEGCETGPAPNQFPAGMGASPTDEERERLVAWIEAGLP